LEFWIDSDQIYLLKNSRVFARSSLTSKGLLLSGQEVEHFTQFLVEQFPKKRQKWICFFDLPACTSPNYLSPLAYIIYSLASSKYPKLNWLLFLLHLGRNIPACGLSFSLNLQRYPYGAKLQRPGR
jgi:hypothetical protein